MIPPTFATAVNICNSVALAIASGGAFNTASKAVQSAAGTAMVFDISQLGRVQYQYIDVTLSNVGTVAASVALTLCDAASAAQAQNQFTYNVILPLRGTKVVARLPYMDFVESLSVNSGVNTTVVVEKIEVVPAPDAFAFNQSIIGQAVAGIGITTAITGTGVTNNGFSAADVHSWDLLTGDTGGITYTFAPALVAGGTYTPPVFAAPNPPGVFAQYNVAPVTPAVVPTYYVVQLTVPVAANVSYNGLTHQFQGSIQLLLSAADFASLVLAVSCANASGATQTFTLTAYAANFNFASNVWASQVTIGG